VDVKISYEVTGSKAALTALVRPRVIRLMESVVRQTVDAYLRDLSQHMGGIMGDKPYSDGEVHWDALDQEQLEDHPRFWIESGKAKRSITANIKTTANSIDAFVGISEGSEGYQEVLWNELGFTPENGDKLIRRPLFIPLAETHLEELKKRIRESMSSQVINIRI